VGPGVQLDGRHVDALELPGDGGRRPVVLLHEGLGSIGLWRDFPVALQQATGRRIVVYSRPGHGRSEPPDDVRTADLFAYEADVVLPAVLAAFAARDPVLIGHSDGGTIALLHAATHDVSGVIAMAPHVFVEVDCLAGLRDTAAGFDAGELRTRMGRHHDDPDHVFRSWSNLWLDPGFAAWSIESELETVTAPVLLVHGIDDGYGTIEQLDRITCRVRGPVRCVEVPAGHDPHLERSDLVLPEIIAFLEQVP
jgi:pimeloyl-ACP methyl ester carboxylesterase